MDKLIINQFKLDTNIGIYQHEKENKQTLYFNLEVSTCLKKAGKSDNIKDTINYEKIIKVIKDISKNTVYNLLETLAEDIMNTLFTNSKSIQAIKITILKTDAIPEVNAIGVSLFREQER